ncbi:MAG: Hsp20 family protein, partial [Oscillospiraceae bacterium]|nr:Hsp20 family protein [Oscillospiraceae bacterium]
SFYVGEYITEEDISAKFEDGVLRLSVPKKEAPKLPEKKTIRID